MVRCVWMRLPGALGKGMENWIGSIVIDLVPVPFVRGLLVSVVIIAMLQTFVCLSVTQDLVDGIDGWTAMMVMFDLFAVSCSAFLLFGCDQWSINRHFDTRYQESLRQNRECYG